LQIREFFTGQIPQVRYASRRPGNREASTAMATITKRELAIKITNVLGEVNHKITQKEVLDVIQTLIVEITESLAKGDTVVMRNFGTFEVREVRAKIGRNPKNPTKVVRIPARASVKFKSGKQMKEKVASSLKIIRQRKK
jgi:nucleoid DNA-binding protein